MKKSAFIIFIAILTLGISGFGIYLLLATQSAVYGGILIGIAILLLLFVVFVYNKLVNYKNKVKESLSLVDIQLKLRFDLIPNLVETVKSYARHEKELFAEIARIRSMAIDAQNEEEKLEYANKLVPQMKTLVAIAENYPELKANTLFKNLMEQLVDIEDRLVSARRIYSSNVNIYNTSLQVFPQNLVATAFNFTSEPLFQIEAGEKIVYKIEGM